MLLTVHERLRCITIDFQFETGGQKHIGDRTIDGFVQTNKVKKSAIGVSKQK